ncbi:MAG: squalene/phytoene synthase family protein [Fibrobacter sp.]|jgi:farnesyl-diphosphate farnesyltransferase|nr:squalene/phytoene synthase family protein [Fibrobacter sp.]
MNPVRSKENFAYADKMLLLVSRTFALNINVLSGDLKKAVLLAYLYLRIADTVEDDPVLPALQKEALLGLFAGVFKDGGYHETALRDFLNALPESWRTSADPNYELCVNTETVVSLLPLLPLKYVRPVSNVVQEMCGGMAKYALKQEARLAKGWFTLETVAELDDYCYYVAGIVGKLLTELFIVSAPAISEERAAAMRKLDVSFGLSLQVTNIIKDIHEDASRKVCFVPEALCREFGIPHSPDLFSPGVPIEKKGKVMDALIQKAWGHLKDALDYTLRIPRRYARIRLFCLWPLFMAAENLRVIGKGENLFLSEQKLKISRVAVKKIIRKTMLHFYSDSWLRREFLRMRA